MPFVLLLDTCVAAGPAVPDDAAGASLGPGLLVAELARIFFSAGAPFSAGGSVEPELGTALRQSSARGLVDTEPLFLFGNSPGAAAPGVQAGFLDDVSLFGAAAASGVCAAVFRLSAGKPSDEGAGGDDVAIVGRSLAAALTSVSAVEDVLAFLIGLVSPFPGPSLLGRLASASARCASSVGVTAGAAPASGTVERGCESPRAAAWVSILQCNQSNPTPFTSVCDALVPPPSRRPTLSDRRPRRAEQGSAGQEGRAGQGRQGSTPASVGAGTLPWPIAPARKYGGVVVRTTSGASPRGKEVRACPAFQR